MKKFINAFRIARYCQLPVYYCWLRNDYIVDDWALADLVTDIYSI